VSAAVAGLRRKTEIVFFSLPSLSFAWLHFFVQVYIRVLTEPDNQGDQMSLIIFLQKLLNSLNPRKK
jgi:hypothetical protein